MSKTLKTRMVQKHDYELNWAKATGFVPLHGEIIIYDAETQDIVDAQIASFESGVETLLSQLGRTSEAIPYQRLKVGNGVDIVVDLPFVVSKDEYDKTYTLKHETEGSYETTIDSEINSEEQASVTLKATNGVKESSVVATAGAESTVKLTSEEVILDADLISTDGNTSFGVDNISKMHYSHLHGNRNTAKVLSLHKGESEEYSYYTFTPLEYDGSGNCIKAELQFDIKEDLNEVLSVNVSSSTTGEHLVNWIEDVGYVYITFVYRNYKTRKEVPVSYDNGIYTIQSIELLEDDVDLIYDLELPDGEVLVLIQGGLCGEEAEYNPGFSSFATGSDNIVGLGAFSEGSTNRAVGYVSHTEGHNTEALGEYSHAQNWTTSALGVASTAMGGRTVAIGQYSTAVGHLTTAKGARSFASGLESVAKGDASAAFGYDTSADGDRAFAAGANTRASGTTSAAMGINSQATNTGAVALGSSARANGFASFATNHQSLAESQYSAVFGIASAALSDGAIASGRLCVAGGTATYSNGTWEIKDTNKGKYSFVGGLESVVQGDQAFGFGYRVQTHSSAAVAFGRNTSATGVASFSVGDGCSTLSDASIAIGSSCSTGEKAAYAIAAGRSCAAKGYASVALGHGEKAYGNYNIAIGHGSTAGEETGAKECCVAIGHQNVTTGQNSVSLGAGLQATSDNQIVVGSYNNPTNSLFIVGSGSSASSRKNAFEVLNDGSIKLADTMITESQLKSLLAILEKNPALATDTAITKDADGNIVLA